MWFDSVIDVGLRCGFDFGIILCRTIFASLFEFEFRIYFYWKFDGILNPAILQMYAVLLERQYCLQKHNFPLRYLLGSSFDTCCLPFVRQALCICRYFFGIDFWINLGIDTWSIWSSGLSPLGNQPYGAMWAQSGAPNPSNSNQKAKMFMRLSQLLESWSKPVSKTSPEHSQDPIVIYFTWVGDMCSWFWQSLSNLTLQIRETPRPRTQGQAGTQQDQKDQTSWNKGSTSISHQAPHAETDHKMLSPRMQGRRCHTAWRLQ